MKKKLVVEKKVVEYELRKSKRARRLRLAVYCDGSVVVTSPYGLHQSIVERYVKEKTNWLFSKIAYFKQFEGKSIARFSDADFLKHKDAARKLVERRVNHFNKVYRYSFNQINIKNQKTRWGSCSKKGNLNFNYRILFLPKKVQDYIIVHELCHLKEFNHSKKYWNLVAKTFPNYRDIQSELQKYTMSRKLS